MRKIPALIRKIEQNSDDICTIYFDSTDRNYVYKAGQYITVYFEGSSTPHGKPYSLSSAPSDKHLSITVKRIGEFSRRIHNLHVGDTMLISEPYGHFYVPDDKPIVAIASGVGIAPIWSIVKHHAPLGRQIELHYSNATEEAVVFKDEIESVLKIAGGRLRHYITRGPTSHTPRRVNVSTDIDTTRDVRYYLCGSQDFVTSMWRQLRDCAVDVRNISTETFFESTSW